MNLSALEKADVDSGLGTPQFALRLLLSCAQSSILTVHGRLESLSRASRAAR